jgi:hypothetical protein
MQGSVTENCEALLALIAETDVLYRSGDLDAQQAEKVVLSVREINDKVADLIQWTTNRDSSPLGERRKDLINQVVQKSGFLMNYIITSKVYPSPAPSIEKKKFTP